MSLLDAISERYLGITEKYSPTFKDFSDNLRAFLTIVAYSVAIRYLWEMKHADDIAPYAFRFVALLWGAWLSWYLVLTTLQTVHLIGGFLADLLRLLFADSIDAARREGKIGPEDVPNWFRIVALVGSSIGVIFLVGIMYIISALLSLAQLR